MITPSPQLENGYTRIANELLDAIMKSRLSPHESQIFNAILRQTYGFGKKEARISLDKFCEMTGLTKPRVCEARKSLLERCIITLNRNTSVKVYGIQKDYSKWRELRKTGINKSKDNESHRDKPSSLRKTGKKEITENRNLPLRKTGKTITENRNLVGPQTKGDKDLQNPKESIKKIDLKETIMSLLSESQAATNTNPSKSSLIILTAEESECWTILEGIEGFPAKNEARVEHLQKYIKKFPNIDPVKLCEKFSTWLIDHPLTAKSNPMSRLYTFFKNAAEKGWGPFRVDKNKQITSVCKLCGAKMQRRTIFGHLAEFPSCTRCGWEDKSFGKG